MDDFTILDLALTYCWTLLWTRDRNLRLPGAFLGTLPFPITTVLEEGWIGLLLLLLFVLFTVLFTFVLFTLVLFRLLLGVLLFTLFT